MNNLSAAAEQSNRIDVNGRTLGIVSSVGRWRKPVVTTATQHLNLFFKLLEVKIENDKDSDYNLKVYQVYLNR